MSVFKLGDTVELVDGGVHGEFLYDFVGTVGKVIRVSNAGTSIEVKGVDGGLWNASIYKSVKAGKKSKVKPEGRISYKVLKNSCNNYETTIKANTNKEAIQEFKKSFKLREGFTLYKPLMVTEEEKKVLFKEVK